MGIIEQYVRTLAHMAGAIQGL